MNIEELFNLIDDRVNSNKKKSYTNKILKLGPKKLLKNLGKNQLS